MLLGLLGGASVVLARSQAGSERALEDRFAARSLLSAEFVSTYAAQLLDREREVAEATLTSATPQRPLDSLVAAFGFHTGLLLDATGRVLALSPATPSLLGTEVASASPHLTAALAGKRAISPVVPSAAGGDPAVGFAVPFRSPTGLRVVSGAFRVSDTPLESYLAAGAALRGHRVFIVDEGGTVVAASAGSVAGRAVDDLLPELAGRLRGGDTGVVRGTDGVPQFFAVHDITGTPWRLATVVPIGTLLQPVSGVSRWLPWLILAVTALAVALVFWLGVRLVDSRRRLLLLNDRLDALASLDALTGLANRRRTTELLTLEQDRCERAEIPLSVLLIDIDHFKRVNDTFGHASGDEVLVEVAGRMAAALREGDHVGRWGGEEFVVVLPGRDLGEAHAVAERLREAVAACPVSVGTGGDEIDVTTSTGVASSTHASVEVLVHTADRALYAAKAAGRNLVVTSPRPT